jgi:hypothetical protein
MEHAKRLLGHALAGASSKYTLATSPCNESTIDRCGEKTPNKAVLAAGKALNKIIVGSRR